MREIRTSGSMSGEGKPPAASRSRSSALPRLYSAEPFVQVSWAKGIDLKTGRPIMTPEAFYDKTPVTLVPTAGGAHNWAPMSFNPATGLVYIPSTYGSWTFVAGDEVVALQTGHTGLGTVSGTPIVPPAIGPQPLEGQRGVLQAWDPVNQKLVWRTPGGGGIGGGTVTTAGNLVFQVIIDGRLMAYSADKGEKLLEIQTNRNGMGAPITYMIDGKQYVAFMGGAGRPPQVVGPTDDEDRQSTDVVRLRIGWHCGTSSTRRGGTEACCAETGRSAAQLGYALAGNHYGAGHQFLRTRSLALVVVHEVESSFG